MNFKTPRLLKCRPQTLRALEYQDIKKGAVVPPGGLARPYTGGDGAKA